jgi:hypothetical protein
VRSLSEFLALPSHRDEARRLGIAELLAHAREELERVRSPEYLASLDGTIGADPIHHTDTRAEAGIGRAGARATAAFTN